MIWKSLFLSKRYPAVLLVLFAVWFCIWAIHPTFPSEFLLEHIFTAGFVVFLVWHYYRFRLSNISYTMIFLFMCLHVVGAHSTYSKVPYEEWFRVAAGWFGVENFSFQKMMGFERNHYDRLVHLSFGLLMAYPAREIFIRVARVRGFWGYFLPLDVTMSFSMVYELIEWAVAVFLAGDIGPAYLGTQGDEWDAQKDMALAMLGGFITMTITALLNWRFKRDFAAEFINSLTPKSGQPLGEVVIAKVLKEEKKSSQPPQKEN